MAKTVVGLFSSIAQGQQVKTRLVGEGYDEQDISVVANDEDATNDYNETDTSSHRYEGKPGIGEKISNFFSSLTGGDDEAHHHYAQGVNQGGALVAVKVDDDEHDEVASRLRELGAREIENDGSYGQTSYGSSATGSSAYGNTSYGNTPGTDPTGRRLADANENLAHEVTPITETGNGNSYGSTSRGNAVEGRDGVTAIPVVEEELLVGKREVDRGGVRVYSHVREVPVEEQVTLRDERIVLERRPVNRPATAADFAAGRDASIELTATGEEAVIGKQSRVVEEVLVGKETGQHTQEIHDSVRKTEVEVDEVPAQAVGNGQVQ